MTDSVGGPHARVERVLVLGSGSAGLLAAIALAVKFPSMRVTVLHDSAIPIIGVGEGTTKRVPIFLHGYLGIDPGEFHALVRPSYKLGIRLLWGPRPRFHYTFTSQLDVPPAPADPAPGFFCAEEFDFADTSAALMAHDKGFALDSVGKIHVEPHLAYHLHNRLFVEFLSRFAQRSGVEMVDGRVESVSQDEQGITGLTLEAGRRMEADFYVDCSGFRAELIGRLLNEPFESFGGSLYCDRAVVGGWPRRGEEILPHTTAETMDAGWCWRIEHEDAIHRGYVYASAFIGDEAAEREFRRKNPKLGETRIVRFQSGARRRTWVKNVVAIGNAAGFVEPLEATALTAICDHVGKLVHALVDSHCRIDPVARHLYNGYTSRQWRAIRRFLALHYKFNRRIDSEFWRACQADTDLSGAEELLEYYQACGPSRLLAHHALGSDDPFSWEGYLVMLVGMQVPHRAECAISASSSQAWSRRVHEWRRIGETGVSMTRALKLIRAPEWQWDLDFYRRACRW